MEGPYGRFVEDVQKALSSMKTRKAAGLSVIASDLLKLCVRKVFQNCWKWLIDYWKEKRCQIAGNWVTCKGIYKGKGDVKLCGNYKSVKLLEHGMKVVEKMLEERLGKVVDIEEMQIGFMPGKSIIDVILSVIQVMEKYELAWIWKGIRLHSTKSDLLGILQKRE